jgi:hypothetical protein
MKSSLADIRRRRFALLLEERAQGNISELGRLIDRSPSLTHDLLSGRKSFGEKIARQIEARLGLGDGDLDREESAPSQAAIALARDIERLSEIDIQDVRAFIRLKFAVRGKLEPHE